MHVIKGVRPPNAPDDLHRAVLRDRIVLVVARIQFPDELNGGDAVDLPSSERYYIICAPLIGVGRMGAGRSC